MAPRSRTSRVAHVLERIGLAMAGASGGLYVAVHTARAGVDTLALPAIVFAMMVFGAVGFYLGIDLPPRASAARAGVVDDETAGTKRVERLSAAGTFLAAAAAFVSVCGILIDSGSGVASTLAVGGAWLLGGAMQILAGTIARIND